MPGARARRITLRKLPKHAGLLKAKRSKEEKAAAKAAKKEKKAKKRKSEAADGEQPAAKKVKPAAEEAAAAAPEPRRKSPRLAAQEAAKAPGDSFSLDGGGGREFVGGGASADAAVLEPAEYRAARPESPPLGPLDFAASPLLRALADADRFGGRPSALGMMPPTGVGVRDRFLEEELPCCGFFRSTEGS